MRQNTEAAWRARKRHRTGQQNLKHVIVLREAELALLNAHNGDRADLNEVGADRLAEDRWMDGADENI